MRGQESRRGESQRGRPAPPRRRPWLLLGGGVAAVAVALGAILAAWLSSGEGTPVTVELTPVTAHAMGVATAPVTVVKFSDFL